MSSQRYGAPVVGLCGGRWLVRWYRAPALGPPESTASLDILAAVLEPRWGRVVPTTEPPPAASWVMGRSAR